MEHKQWIERKKVVFKEYLFFKHGHCDCLPKCNSTKYSATINYIEELDHDTSFIEPSKIQIKLKNLEANESLPSDLQLQNMWKESSVSFTVGFKESMFLTMKRSPMYAYADFFASCGGLFGLFMGMSILSFNEIIYFFTVRLFH